MKVFVKVIIAIIVIALVVCLADVAMGVRSQKIYKEAVELGQNSIKALDEKNFKYEENWKVLSDSTNEVAYEVNSKDGEILIKETTNGKLSYLAYKNADKEINKMYRVWDDLDFVTEGEFNDQDVSECFESMKNHICDGHLSLIDFMAFWKYSVSDEESAYVVKEAGSEYYYSKVTGLVEKYISNNDEGCIEINYLHSFNKIGNDLNELYEQEYVDSLLDEKDSFEEESFNNASADLLNVLNATIETDLRENVLLAILNNIYEEQEISDLVDAIIGEEKTIVFDGDETQAIIKISDNGKKLLDLAIAGVENQDIDKKDRVLLITMLNSLYIEDEQYSEKIINTYLKVIEK